MALILRRLGEKESTILKRPSSKNFVHTFRIKTRLDLYKKLSLVQNAIEEWIKMHELLRSRIHKDSAGIEYFSLYDKEIKPKNVQFLKFVSKFDYGSKIDKFLDELDTLLIEKEFSNLITEEDELLWRLVFLKIEVTEPCSEHQYNVLFNINHAISEARNSYAIFYQLLNLIEESFSKKLSSNQTEYKIIPSLEDIFPDWLEAKNKNKTLSKSLKRPHFNDLSRAKKIKFNFPKILNEINILNGKFYSLLEPDVVFEINELIEISRKSCTKFRKFELNNSTSSQLIKKSKDKHVKLTSCFNLIIIISFIKLYKMNGLDLDEIVFYVSVSLRNSKNLFSNKEIPDEIMGYYNGGIIPIFYNKYQNVEDLIKNFWTEVKLMSDEFHQNLKNDVQKFYPKLTTVTDTEKELSIHFGMSNLGAPSNFLTKQKCIEITKSYFFSNVTPVVLDKYFFNYITTINGKIYWAIGFNSFGLEQSIPDQMIDFYFNIIDQVLNLD